MSFIPSSKAFQALQDLKVTFFSLFPPPINQSPFSPHPHPNWPEMAVATILPYSRILLLPQPPRPRPRPPPPSLCPGRPAALSHPPRALTVQARSEPGASHTVRAGREGPPCLRQSAAEAGQSHGRRRRPRRPRRRRRCRVADGPEKPRGGENKNRP